MFKSLKIKNYVLKLKIGFKIKKVLKLKIKKN